MESQARKIIPLRPVAPPERETPPGDAELMQAVARGETAALEMLYDRYSRHAIALAYRIVGRMDVAEEVAQDVFLKVWERPHMYDAERGRFVSWLLRLVHNHALNEQRRGHNRLTVSAHADNDDKPDLLTLLPDDGLPPDDLVWIEERRTAVRAALAQLTGPQRTVIEMAYFGGLNQSEIAARLGTPLGTVKTRIRLGLQKLKHILDTQGISAS